MKEIKEHIKNGTYKPVYLLTGTEPYLRRLYTSKLVKGALGDADSMNLSRFSGKDVDWNEVAALADTLPFFADCRVLVFEDTGCFKNSCDFADHISKLPDTVVLIFNESEVDKRGRMYKAVKEYGYISEMNGLSENELSLWVAQLLGRDQKKISKNDLQYLLSRIGGDMENVETEVEKLVCYVAERDVITASDINAVTTEQISGRIFAMMDALGARNKALALSLYHDLLSVREKPMSILFLMIRQCNMILMADEMNREGVSRAEIASKAGIPPFAVGKCLSQAHNFSPARLRSLISYGTGLEEDVKSGRMDERMAVEIFLLTAVN